MCSREIAHNHSQGFGLTQGRSRIRGRHCAALVVELVVSHTSPTLCQE